MYKKILFTLITTLSLFANAEQKTIQAIVTIAPGGGLDLSVRHFEKYLAEKKNINLALIHKPGAESLIGSIDIANSPKDGSVIGFNTIGLLASVLEKNKNLEFELISATRKYAAVMVASQKTNIIDYNDFVNKARSGTDFKFAQGSANQKIQVDYLLSVVKPKINPVVVPYKGAGPVINDLLGGHVDIAIVPYAVVKDHIAFKKLKLIATTSKLVDHPNITVLTKLYPNFVDYGGYCLILPKNTDPAVVSFWRTTVEEYLTDPKMKEEFAKEASEPYPYGEKFLKDIIREYQRKFPS